MRKLSFCLFFLLFTGCMTTEERMAADDRQCQSYGAAPGSDAYVQCRLQIDKQRGQQRMINSTSPVGTLFNLAQ